MKVNIRVTGDRVLVTAPENEAEHKVGGLIVPQSITPLAEVCVVAVGPGRWLESGALPKSEVEPGEWVLINRHSGQEIERNGVKYRLLSPHEIMAVLQD